MKKSFLWMTFLAMLLGFGACKHEVDLYADYRDVPIIYGLLDANADTNYIKITRAFYGGDNVHQIAQNPDSCNFPGRLDARLTEFRNGEMTREIILDTITIRNKLEGTFYAPTQKLYYTAERLGKNSATVKFSYQLTVVLPNDTIVTQCDIVGGDGFKVQSLAFNFSKEYFGTYRPFKFNPAIGASIYQFRLAFTFLEQRAPDSDSVPRTMFWDLGVYDDYYYSTHMEDNCYVLLYRPNSFYDELKEFIGGDTIGWVRRYIGDYPLEITIEAGGEKLKKYMYFNNPTSGIAPGDVEFSLIEGGFGVFSSRMTLRKKLRMAGTTVPDLVAMTNWGFKFMGGKNDEPFCSETKIQQLND